ncbi:MAG: hypothetical protein L6Q37_01240 [Bdellovibrionaceae bacterium]|nr:hypothetical protein [Pseudobdellovibrionaceae bacterium]NUM57670.1 hypothetical protein [Pseudobdellovibrionaceae bacterium]
MLIKSTFKALSLLSLLFVIVNCQKNGGSSSSNATTEIPESSVCHESKSFPNHVTLTGSAVYFYRPVNSVYTSHGYIKVLSGNPVSDAISYAEINLLDSNSNIIQCGTTNLDGSFSIDIPKDSGTLTLRIYSRAYNARIKTSILEDPTSNKPYFIEKSFNIASVNVNAGEIQAMARQSESSKMEGAAFHILKTIYYANEYLKTQLSDNSWVSDKVSVYWKAGFNPYSYYGYPDSLISFYKPGEHKLFILGGYNGDVAKSDTDHFDKSVILHEYGHFLEDVYGKTDSPGGYHNGDAVIDPRLAWSEGFANFVQAAILGKNYYLDTSGYCNDTTETKGTCSQNVYITIDDDANSTNLDNMPTNTPSGEGNFREISITRTLYKVISPTSLTYPIGAGIPFKEIWNVFSNPFYGFHSPSQAFRSSILMNKGLDSIISSTYSSNNSYWLNILSQEKQSKVFKNYANPLNEQTINTCSNTYISPVADLTLCAGTSCPFYKKSNQFKSNDFYKITITNDDIAANAIINLSYAQSDANQPVDLDLYLYREDYTYFEEYEAKEYGEQSDSIVKTSNRAYGSIENGSESLTLSQLTPGTYMLVVKANTYGKTSSGVGVEARYRLTKTINSSQRDLCPAN